MDKVRIQEIAEEAGLSNGELLAKAKELGYNVKAANSSINMEEAGILVDYAISGTLPKGFKKPAQKTKITIVKKKPEEEADTSEPPQAEESSEGEGATVEAESVTGEEPEAKEEEAPEVKETVKTKSAPPVSGIQKSAKKKVEPKVAEGETAESKIEAAESVKEEKQPPKKKSLSRGGITIVRKAKRAPVKKKISMADTIPAAPKKKKPEVSPANWYLRQHHKQPNSQVHRED